MGSSWRESEREQSIDYYVENTVFVAVGKQVDESESLLMWAAQKFAKKKKICILHIHQPPHLLTLFGGKSTTSKLQQKAIKALHEANKQKLHKLINEYVILLSRIGVRPDRMWIEMDNIEEGIVNLIVQHGIKWLVMGAAANKHYSKKMLQLKSQKAIFVCERAPDSCHIWFICRGNLIHTREGLNYGPSVTMSQVAGSLHPDMKIKDSNQARSGNPCVDLSLEPKSVDSNSIIEDAKNASLVDSGVDSLSQNSTVGTQESEPGSPYSSIVTEEEQHPKLYPGEDSHGSSGESREPELESPNSDTATDEEGEDLNLGNLGVITSPDKDVASEGSEQVSSYPAIYDKGSPPRLTFQERSSVLKACSVDLNSHEEKFMFPSPQHFRASSLSVKSEEDPEFWDKKKILGLSASFDSALLEDRKAGKVRLGARKEILDKLKQAISEAKALKHKAFQESINQWKAEEFAMDTKNKAEAAESKYRKEMKRRKEIEEKIEKQKLQCQILNHEIEKYKRQLLRVQDECSALKDQIRESELSVKEFEEKIISAVGLLISFREKRDRLQIEHDEAIEEIKKLNTMKEQRMSILSGPQFPTFSLMEINEATYSFNPSKRIGDGRYGSIFQGTLAHMEVAIWMLPNDGSQGQWSFEREVEIVSRVRHPNIAMLIGTSPEARSLVYEYHANGSLEDHLVCRGKYPPLKWQIRERIAIELCSALIFLHTSQPPIFHGNLKPTKILLDANLVSKIGDLGISRLIPQNQIPLIRRTVYTDPEFFDTGVLTPDSDVYSFGVILLLLLTGRPPDGLVKDVRSALRKDKLEMVLDSSAGNWPIDEAKILAWLALRCSDKRRSNRPDLASEVWSFLEPLRKSCTAQISCLEKKANRLPPSHFICPIYKEVMQDPCTAADGYTYEREAISGWLDSDHKTSPMTNLELSNCDLIPNYALSYAIQEWSQTA